MTYEGIGVHSYKATFTTIFHCEIGNMVTEKNNSNDVDGPSWWLSGKESACQCKSCEFDPWAGKMPWRREWQPTLVFLAGESHGQRSLVGYSPRGCKESDMT